jgi:hypothetical protein
MDWWPSPHMGLRPDAARGQTQYYAPEWWVQSARHWWPSKYHIWLWNRSNHRDNVPTESPIEYRAFLFSWSLFTLVQLRRLNVLVSLFLISAIVEGILVRLKCRVTVDNWRNRAIRTYMSKTNKFPWLIIRQPINLNSHYERFMKAAFNVFISVNILSHEKYN